VAPVALFRPFDGHRPSYGTAKQSLTTLLKERGAAIGQSHFLIISPRHTVVAEIYYNLVKKMLRYSAIKRFRNGKFKAKNAILNFESFLPA